MAEKMHQLGILYNTSAFKGIYRMCETNLLVIVSEPHGGVQSISEFPQDFILAGFERVTETYRVVPSNAVPLQAFLVDALCICIRRNSKATRTGLEWVAWLLDPAQDTSERRPYHCTSLNGV